MAILLSAPVTLQRTFTGTATVNKRIAATDYYTEASTTNATPTTILSIAVPLNNIRKVFAEITCLRSDGTEGGGGDMSVTFRRGASGNVVKTSAETIIDFSEDSSGTPTISAALDTTNQLGLIQVTGEAAKNFTWTCYAHVSGQTL